VATRNDHNIIGLIVANFTIIAGVTVLFLIVLVKICRSMISRRLKKRLGFWLIVTLLVDASRSKGSLLRALILRIVIVRIIVANCSILTASDCVVISCDLIKTSFY
jgi:hypothetical protein